MRQYVAAYIRNIIRKVRHIVAGYIRLVVLSSFWYSGKN